MRNLIGMGLLVSSVAAMGADDTASQRMEDGCRVWGPVPGAMIAG